MCKLGKICAGLGKGQGLGGCGWEVPWGNGSPSQYPRSGLKPSVPLGCSPFVGRGCRGCPCCGLVLKTLFGDPKAAPAWL